MKILKLGLLALFLTVLSSSSQAFFFNFNSDFGDGWHFGDGWYYDYYGRNAYHPYYSRHAYRPYYRNYVAQNPYACRRLQQLEQVATTTETE